MLFDRAEPEPIFTLLGDPLLESKGDHRCHGAISLSYPGSPAPTANAGKKKTKTGWGDLELNEFSTLFKKEVGKNVTSCVCVSSGNPGGRADTFQHI